MARKVVIVGYGSIGKRHLRIARSLLPDADIRVLRREAGHSVPEFANGLFNTIEQAAAFAPDLSVLANPAPLHLRSALLLAKAGSHLLIEKPLASSTAEADAFLREVPPDIRVLVGYNLRFSPSLQKFREMILADSIGGILSLRLEVGQYLPSWRPDSDYRTSVSAQESLGGGALLELSHELDYLRWIFGDVDWVQGLVSRQSSLEIDVEDSAQLLIGMQRKARAPAIASVSLDFIRHDRTRSCTAIGEKGSLRWNAITGSVEQCMQGDALFREVFSHTPVPDETYLAEWNHLLACIDASKKPDISPEDGRAVLAIVDAARQASQSGCRTHVKDR
jgi:predicted dehydrogenase